VLDADGRAEIPAVVDAIYLAIESGADIINLSFGLQSDEKPDSLKDALKEAKDAGVLVVAAAGNGGDDQKRYPASEGSVISVGALDVTDDNQVAGFSSHGKWVLLAAPGVGIVSSVPGGGYATWAGTSMAAPVVSGQAALLVQVDPEAKRNDVEKALKDSAHKMHGDHKAEKGAIDILESIIDMM
jgi:thermitase